MGIAALDQCEYLETNFLNHLRDEIFPDKRNETTLEKSLLSKEQLIELFKSAVTSRHLDLLARELKTENRTFYTISSCGHEANAAFGLAFPHTDMAFLHYRSCALYLQRAKQVGSFDAVQQILLSLMADQRDINTGGRHKVYSSLELNIPPQTSTIASHCPKAVGAALSLRRAAELKIQSKLDPNSIILCSFGDASCNHASAQSAFNTAQWISYHGYPLPLIFICEDNGIGISVPTPADWVRNQMEARSPIHYITCDGLSLLDTYRAAKEAEKIARNKKQAVFLHMKCNRLLGHAGSDIESHYLSEQRILNQFNNDPLLHNARDLIEYGCLNKIEIENLYLQEKEALIKRIDILGKPEAMTESNKVIASLIPSIKNINSQNTSNTSLRDAYFSQKEKRTNSKRNLCQLINYTLADIMFSYDNVVLFGEDVGKKGGVYRVTADLQATFGQRRVFDTLLDETTILGTAIGMAHNSFLPIPEIQFLAYFHNAEDQIRSEAATLPFFSNGKFSNPMIVRIASFAYQRGFGGHFHNDNSIAVLRDIPGLIIAAPSNGEDASKMLRACVDLAMNEGRIIAFLEPIALYMMKDLHEAGDNEWLHHYPEVDQKISLEEIGVFGDAEETVIISYANGYYLSRQAAKILEAECDIKVKIIDLRWIAPLAERAIIAEIKNAENILIVDECRRTGSLSEALVTLITEAYPKQKNVQRITGHDTFIPLGTAAQCVLPSKDDIVYSVKKMKKINCQRDKARGVNNG